MLIHLGMSCHGYECNKPTMMYIVALFENGLLKKKKSYLELSIVGKGPSISLLVYTCCYTKHVTNTI